jgi:DNA polymerase III alpha subunit
MIQLRVRTEYSFRTNYGPIPIVVERLKEIGCKAAGIVDTHGTWGHVTWEKEMKDSGIEPLYGSEFKFNGSKFWVLAQSLPEFLSLQFCLGRGFRPISE